MARGPLEVRSFRDNDKVSLHNRTLTSLDGKMRKSFSSKSIKSLKGKEKK